MHCKVDKIGVDPITFSSDELRSVDIAPSYLCHTIRTREVLCDKLDHFRHQEQSVAVPFWRLENIIVNWFFFKKCNFTIKMAEVFFEEVPGHFEAGSVLTNGFNHNNSFLKNVCT